MRERGLRQVEQGVGLHWVPGKVRVAGFPCQGPMKNRHTGRPDKAKDTSEALAPRPQDRTKGCGVAAWRPPEMTGSPRATALTTCSLSPGPRPSKQRRLAAAFPFFKFPRATWSQCLGP